MNGHEADALAARIAGTWRGGPIASVWAEELLDLDAGTAGTAYARLRRSEDSMPTVSRFLYEYRQLRTVSVQPLPEDKCKACDGTRWVPGPPDFLPSGNPEKPYRYETVVRCEACRAFTRRICPKCEHCNFKARERKKKK